MEYAPVHFGLTGAQQRLQASVRELLAEASPPERVRRVIGTAEGLDVELWRAMAARGLLRLPGFVEVAVVAEELGAALACVPFLSTAVLAAALLPPGGELPSEATAAVAFVDDGGRWDVPGAAVDATPSAHGWVLHGHASFVLDGMAAAVLVVAARTPSGTSMFAVAGDAGGLSRCPLPTVDRTRRLARLELSGTPARLLGTEGHGTVALERAADRAVVALAAEQVGGARRCLDAAVAHVLARRQFGRPLGSFQAVKHTLAEVLVDVESARSTALFGAWAADHSPDELPAAASVAKACCSEAYARAAAASLHLHGALGFTWDADAHLYYRRARSSQLLFGDPAYHRERLARRMGVGGG
jgi:alkylation response protein AidB-like acyl-CoA dehydrogenase